MTYDDAIWSQSAYLAVLELKHPSSIPTDTVRIVQNVAMDCFTRASPDGSQPWPPTADCWYGERAADIDDSVPKWCVLIGIRVTCGVRMAPVARTYRGLSGVSSVVQEWKTSDLLCLPHLNMLLRWWKPRKPMAPTYRPPPVAELYG